MPSEHGNTVIRSMSTLTLLLCITAFSISTLESPKQSTWAWTRGDYMDWVDCARDVKMDSMDEKDDRKLSGFHAVLPAILPASPPLL